MGDMIHHTTVVPVALSGQRFDQIAAHCFSAYSRSKLQAWIRQGALRVDGELCKPKDKLLGGETLILRVEIEPDTRWQQEDIALDSVFEDDSIIVINKPAGLVVHPGAGNAAGTLLNGLLYRYPELASLPRAGIVHRLDKNTTGLMVVARTMAAHTSLVSQLQERRVNREYEAVVQGVITAGGVVNLPIGRHPVNRLKMAVTNGGRESITHYRVIKRYHAYTHLRVTLETGRTHQIRVHMAHVRHPLLGDDLYAGGLKRPKACSLLMDQQLSLFRRQALHARRLGLLHPETAEFLQWEAPRPNDFEKLLHTLDNEQGVDNV